MLILRFILFALLSTSLFLVTVRIRWEAHLAGGNRTCIIRLPVRPAWSPPVVPAYDTFQQTFRDLPPKPPAGTIIERVVRYDIALFDLLCFGAASASICGLIYVFRPKGSRDVVLHYASHIAVGMMVAAAICFLLWLVFGGWGPPFPLFFGVMGIALGLMFAMRKWRGA